MLTGNVHMSLTSLFYRLDTLPLSIDWLGIWTYLGETNLFNVILLIVIVVAVYQWKNLNLGEGLDQKIKESLVDLDNAQYLADQVMTERQKLEVRLQEVENERRKRVREAETRAEAYVQELLSETQAKIRKMSEQHLVQKRLELKHLERDLIHDLADALDDKAVERLQSSLDEQTQHRILWKSLEDVEAAYAQQQGRQLEQGAVR